MGRRLRLAMEVAAALANLTPTHRANLLRHPNEESLDDPGRFVSSLRSSLNERDPRSGR